MQLRDQESNQLPPQAKDEIIAVVVLQAEYENMGIS